MEKAKQTLNSWTNRGLSLIGKVQVVNTLIASLFVYKMITLPSMTKNMVKNIENIIREFLWNKGKPKFSLKILQNSKAEGGLNLVNLKAKDKSLKATWPSILHKEEEYSKLVYEIMRTTKIQENIWRCNLNTKDIDNMKIRNPPSGNKFSSAGVNTTTSLTLELKTVFYGITVILE